MSYHTIVGFIVGAIGLVSFYTGWKNREQYQRITETSTTEIRDIDSEGRVEVTGTVRPIDGGDGFASPLGQTTETVVAAWHIKEYHSAYDSRTWQTKVRGVYSEPFIVDDGTARIRVAIGDRVAGQGEVVSLDLFDPSDVLVDGVVCKFRGNAAIEEVNSRDAPPQHIQTFVRDEDALFEYVPNIDNGHPAGRFQYIEETLRMGEEIHLLGNVQATADTTTPLHPENTVVTPVDGEPFIVSNRTEEELTDRFSSHSRNNFIVAALLLLLSVVLIVAGMTPLL